MFCAKCGAEAADSKPFCSKCGSPFDQQDTRLGGAPAPTGKSDTSKIAELTARLSEIESSLPKTNILNVKFWPRAFAVFGHNLAITGILYAVLFALAIGFGILAGIIGAIVR